MTTLIELHGHKVNPANDRLRIFILDEKGSGGAHHVYAILTPIEKTKIPWCGKDDPQSSVKCELDNETGLKLWPMIGFAKEYHLEEENVADSATDNVRYYTMHIVPFQNGPINEVGVNGHTQEVYLAILIHRLECFQAGPFKGEFNENALRHLKEAKMWLLERTRERMNRGVEGTHKQ